MKNILLASGMFLLFVACANEPKATVVAAKKDSTVVRRDTLQVRVTGQSTQKDSALIQNGEYIERYANGVIKIRGMMKDGQRDGLWKSWYENGSKWSETTFKAGKKSGKTTTWYENEKMRYTGFYADDAESGKWSFWDEKGKLVTEKDYGNK